MGTDWGAYENSGGRGVRCGITYTPQAANHGDNYARIDLDFLTQNSAAYSNDAQTLNISGDLSTTINFTNNQGTGVQTRGSRTYSYSYGSNEYGSSPGNATFKSLLSGANNGVTPGVQVTVAIPARPYGVPDPVFFQSAQVNSDTSINVQWLNQSTVGEPYQAMYVDRYTYNYESWTRIANLGAPGGTSTAITAGAQANRKYTYRIWAANSAGSSGVVQTNDVYTTPAAPGSFTRVTSSTTQQLSWTNAVGYGEYKLELWEQTNGGALTYVAEYPAGTTSVNLTGRSLSNKYKYSIRTTATEPLSTYSAMVVSSESSGVTTPPATPTNLAPSGSTVIEPSVPTVFTWTYTTTDTSTQRTYDLEYREVSTSTWITADKTGQDLTKSSWTMPAGTWDNSKAIEWHVRVYGADPTPSAYSATATYLTADPVPVKYPLVINLATGRVEALSGGGAAGIGDANVFYYEQNYTTATSSVGYNHGLGTKGLEIEFYDTGGTQRFGDVTKTVDTITMTFAHPMTGLMIVYGAVAA